MVDRRSPTRVRVQASWINDAEFIGYFVAMSEGYYAEAGLEVQHFPGHAGLVPEMSLLSGDADIALTSPDSLAATIARTGAGFRIIGAQFQKNPLGIVSLASNPITELFSLAGRTLAVPEINRSMVLNLIACKGADLGRLRIVPYEHDVGPLAEGAVDGFVDFIVDGQYKLRTMGFEPLAILLHDQGATLFNNIVVVRAPCDLTDDALSRWLVVSRRGWIENARDLTYYPLALRERWLDNSRSLAQEIFANQTFAPLIENPAGVLAMTDEAIATNISYLRELGLQLDRAVFDNSLLPPTAA